jgi:DNA gyrase/topoisomerase IV subunit A
MGRPNGRQAVKCTAHKTDTGAPCKAWAMVGSKVCVAHGGAAPQVRAKAAQNIAEAEARRALEGLEDYEAITDPIERLQLLAGRAERFMEIVGTRVEELTSMRYRTESEQLRAEVAVYERAIASTGKLLVDLARLNLDERAVKLQEAQVAILAGALAEALAEAGLAPEQRQAITVRVAELVTAAEEQNALAPAGRR